MTVFKNSELLLPVLGIITNLLIILSCMEEPYFS